jgi:hypothetical protein
MYKGAPAFFALKSSTRSWGGLLASKGPFRLQSVGSEGS